MLHKPFNAVFHISPLSQDWLQITPLSELAIIISWRFWKSPAEMFCNETKDRNIPFKCSMDTNIDDFSAADSLLWTWNMIDHCNNMLTMPRNMLKHTGNKIKHDNNVLTMSRIGISSLTIKSQNTEVSPFVDLWGSAVFYRWSSLLPERQILCYREMFIFIEDSYMITYISEYLKAMSSSFLWASEQNGSISYIIWSLCWPWKWVVTCRLLNNACLFEH